jgi:Tfp pilus assembly protein PilF
MRKLCVIAVAALMAGGCSRPTFDRYMSRADRYIAAGKYAEAAIELQNATRVKPDAAIAHLKLAGVFVALGRASQAASEYDRGCAVDELNAAQCEQAAEGLLAVGEFRGAATRARTVLAADRGNLDAHLVLASALMEMRQLDEADEWLQRARRKAPIEPRVYRAFAELQRRRGNPRAAEVSWRRAIQLDPIAPARDRVSLAQLYLETGRTAEAVTELRAAVAADPKDPVANRAYASYLQDTNQCGAAEEYWKQYAATATDGTGPIALADYYVWNGRADDALKVLESAIKADPSGAVRARVASIVYDRGDRDAATRMLDELLVHDQSNVNGLALRSAMALDAGDIATARTWLQRAMAVAPNAPVVRALVPMVNGAGQ